MGSGFENMVGGAALPALAALFGPQGADIQAMCGIDFNKIVTNVMNIATFFPIVVQKAAEVTRKLTVTLSWKEGGRKGERNLTVETFIVAIPEEQQELMKALGRAEDAGLLNQDGATPAPAANPGGGR
jgi:hypothetical protein